MPTPAERRALLFISTVAALGVAVRGSQGARVIRPPESDRAALATQLAAVDSVIARGGGRHARARPRAAGAEATALARSSARTAARDPASTSTPKAATRSALRPAPGSASPDSAPGMPLDLDVATAVELERLPGIGPALAARIVADREALGPFGSIEGFQRVKGIGPALAARVLPHVTFSAPPRPSDTEVWASRGALRP